MAVRISCTACDSTFQIPDALYANRFAGRKTRLRCRECGGVIEVDGTLGVEATLGGDVSRVSGSDVDNRPEETAAAGATSGALMAALGDGGGAAVEEAPAAAPESGKVLASSRSIPPASTSAESAPVESTPVESASVESTPAEAPEQTPPVALVRELPEEVTRVVERTRRSMRAPTVEPEKHEASSRGAIKRAAIAMGLLALASVIPTEQIELLHREVEQTLHGAGAAGTAKPVSASEPAAPSEPEPAPAPAVVAMAEPTKPESTANTESTSEPESAPEPESKAEAVAGAPDEQALARALRWGFARVDECHRGGRAGGTARAIVRFASSGLVEDVRIEGEPIASAPVSRCIVSYLRWMRIPAFEGPSFEVTREFTLR